MDNPNLNPSMQGSSTPNNKQSFPSFEDMQKKANKPQYFVIAVVVILVVGLGVIWYFFKSDIEYAPGQVQRASITPELGTEEQVNSIDVGNVDNAFQAVDKDLNSL